MKKMTLQTPPFLFLVLFLLTIATMVSCGSDSAGSSTPDTVDTSSCVPACEGKVCGDDGCGGTCGTCEEGVTCNSEGLCGCLPSCDGTGCGDDGCGGTCECKANEQCNSSDECVCVPSCETGSCGDNGCGQACNCETGFVCDEATGICGDDPACKGFTFAGCCAGSMLKYCEEGTIKSSNCEALPSCGWNTDNGYYGCGEEENSTDPSDEASGVCPDCTPNCAGVEACGSDGCGGACETCEEGAACFDEACCTPDCTDKTCGSDGCGGSCGECESGLVCAQATGTCIEDPCGTITFEGCCDGEMVKFCENGVYGEFDCTENPSCGWDTGGEWYNCGTDGSEEPSGDHPKACGELCEPLCENKVCGDNGCGGSCGECDGTCSEDGSMCTPTPCVAGETCFPTNPCYKGITACTEMTGTPDCTETDMQPDGMSCGGGKVCQAGVCVEA